MYQTVRKSFHSSLSSRKAELLRASRVFSAETLRAEEAGDVSWEDRLEKASRFGHNLVRPDGAQNEQQPGAPEPGAAGGVIQLNGDKEKKKKKGKKGEKKEKGGMKRKTYKDSDEESESGDEELAEKNKKKLKLEFPDQLQTELGTNWTSYGANQSRVFFKTTESKSKKKNPHNLANNKIGNIFKDTKNVVGKKSYSDLRNKQALRWMSTLAFYSLNKDKKDPREVQSALHKGSLYMATNTKKGNTALKDLNPDKDKTGMEILKNLYDSAKDDKGLSSREKRHLKKLNKRILNETTASKYGDYEAIREALKGSLTIASGGEEGLHAERRIASKVGKKKLPSKSVGGVKRPCTNCYLSLYPTEKDVHPGPYWPSKAANIGFNNFGQNSKSMAKELDKIPGTYVTLVEDQDSKKNSVTFDYDTDSDSDED